METSFILVNSTKGDQEKFERGFKESSAFNRHIEKNHNWAVFLSGPERRKYFMAGYPYVISDKEERDNIISKHS